MRDFIINKGILEKYRGSGGNVMIPDNVIGIGESAFCDCETLISVTVPESVTYIESYAFSECKNLTKVELPNSVTHIGREAFCYCLKLKDIKLPYHLTEISENLFRNCTSLNKILIPESVERIAYGAFCGCSSLDFILIPKNVQKIEQKAFADCTGIDGIFTDLDSEHFRSLNGVLYSKDLTEIVLFPAGKKGAFYISDKVSEFDTEVLKGITGLTEIQVSENSEKYASVDGVLFNKELSTLIAFPAGRSGTYCVPESVTCIADSAFKNCKKLTKITLPEGLEYIGPDAFTNCSGLQHLFEVPESVTWLGISAFQGCSGLTRIILPSGLSHIMMSTFYRCSSLRIIQIPESVEIIEENAFSDCTSLTEITIPSNVKSIFSDAFWDCSSLTDIYFKGNNPFVISADERYRLNHYKPFGWDMVFTAHYPKGNPTWRKSRQRKYGAKYISWVEWDPEDAAVPDLNEVGIRRYARVTANKAKTLLTEVKERVHKE
ncbi:MAG: leucine-rich repeat domain-containing protein [Solobacterium sp.]|nr:leucine-rich repeat domain-containing protein [Solobacterium sp.]